MLIAEAIEVILNSNDRKIVMKDLNVSSPLISSWRSSTKDRIPHFKIAVKVFGIYSLVVYPYNEADLRDAWNEIN